MEIHGRPCRAAMHGKAGVAAYFFASPSDCRNRVHSEDEVPISS